MTYFYVAFRVMCLLPVYMHVHKLRENTPGITTNVSEVPTCLKTDFNRGGCPFKGWPQHSERRSVLFLMRSVLMDR